MNFFSSLSVFLISLSILDVGVCTSTSAEESPRDLGHLRSSMTAYFGYFMVEGVCSEITCQMKGGVATGAVLDLESSGCFSEPAHDDGLCEESLVAIYAAYRDEEDGDCKTISCLQDGLVVRDYIIGDPSSKTSSDYAICFEPRVINESRCEEEGVPDDDAI